MSFQKLGLHRRFVIKEKYYIQSVAQHNNCLHNIFYQGMMEVTISVGQGDRFVHVAPRSLCPGPIRPLDTKKVVENTGNHLRSKLKIWIFVDFQAKSRLYAIAQTLKLQLIRYYNQTSI